MQIDPIARRLHTENPPCFLCAKNKNDVKAPPAAHGQQAVPFCPLPFVQRPSLQDCSVRKFPIPGSSFPVAEIHFLLRWKRRGGDPDAGTRTKDSAAQRCCSAQPNLYERKKPGRDCGALPLFRPASSELDLQGYGYLCVALVRTRRQSGLQAGRLADPGSGSFEQGIGRDWEAGCFEERGRAIFSNGALVPLLLLLLEQALGQYVCLCSAYFRTRFRMEITTSPV